MKNNEFYFSWKILELGKISKIYLERIQFIIVVDQRNYVVDKTFYVTLVGHCFLFFVLTESVSHFIENFNNK